MDFNRTKDWVKKTADRASQCYPSVSKTADFARSQANRVRERFNTLFEEQSNLGTVALG